ncbi:hypothetical protein [uncultured Paraglaciecola sp.]|nr:hypothetical protein [uncultured Paraglaciecola sp.]
MKYAILCAALLASLVAQHFNSGMICITLAVCLIMPLMALADSLEREP